MVTIVINENKGNTVSNITEESIEKLFDEFKELENKITEQNQQIIIMQEHISRLESTLITKNTKKEYTNKDKPIKTKTKTKTKTETKIENKTKHKRIKKSKKNKIKNNTFFPGKSSSKTWDDLKLNKDLEIISKINAKNYREFKLPVNIFDILYIQELDSPHMTRDTVAELVKEFGVYHNMISKIIFNIRENKFDGVIEKFKAMSKALKFTAYQNTLYVNDSNTKIPLPVVNEFIQIIVNSSHKQQTIRQLTNGNYKDYNKKLLLLIGNNYNNPNLMKLLNIPKKDFVENNPSKRKSLIENGVII